MERTDIRNASASTEHELQEQRVTSTTNGKRKFVYRVTKFLLFLSLTVQYFYIKLSRKNFPAGFIHKNCFEWLLSAHFRGTQRRFPPTYIENTF